EKTQKFAHLRAGDKKWRKQANRKVVGAIDEQAAFERFGDKRAAFDRKLHAEHASLAADLFHEIKFRLKFFEALAKFLSARADVFEQLFLFDDFQKFKSDSADHRTATKRRAVQTGRDACRDGVVGQNRTQRQPSGQRFGDYGNVRLRRKLSIREVAPGASQTALNFVGNQQRAMLGSERASTFPKLF